MLNQMKGNRTHICSLPWNDFSAAKIVFEVNGNYGSQPS
jgi:hypothetical protein